MERVAVIGGGPGGLVAARYLKSEGFDPVVLEQGDTVGGQWSADPRFSGVWPSMRTNTSRVMTAFSDLRHEPKTPVYPTNQTMRSYLGRYAERLDLTPRIRLRTRVTEVARDPEGVGWIVRSERREGAAAERYDRVVVATGRFNRPFVPDVPGLDTFSGDGGVSHAFAYKDPDRYRGKSVLVAGCSISALEIASDLAMLGARRVVASNRRQRYIVHKMLAGTPIEHLVFTRFSAMAAESLPVEVVARDLKEFVVRSSGSPETFGAPKPADNVLEAGITLSQHFLPLVAEGRIEVRPWMRGIEGRRVTFEDGTSEEFDGIVFGTGYALHLPFLDEAVRRTIDLDGSHADLYQYTFHPDLAGLAFVGLIELLGPYFPVVETQARWIAYTWSGARPTPDRAEMERGIARVRARRERPQTVPMDTVALMFSRAAGVEPEVARWPELARALFFGPLSPMSFRLSGRDSLEDAPRRVAQDAAAFGAVPSPDLTPDQCEHLRALAAARGDAEFARFVGKVAGESSRA